ncbi:cyclopropane-fatty-acyl-phospholipid synthase [Allopseudospirillum japonicum]|uniref:Cyclopropane-fatty-acyl-phospholipid synthase n=1 Tax=Allopseudospirillum japonicum TaxID=64971 RepID=A0A1H6Q6Z7_9GAMM|nr:cyclopropane-fatty-acyl-phospholipid synthase family protein [Allopseudospirillum japonicum]SEI39538.1 cyclopropane-fatty-acyl-phospholipid synthase [Allopseudospirillum japonicum]
MKSLPWHKASLATKSASPLTAKALQAWLAHLSDQHDGCLLILLPDATPLRIGQPSADALQAQVHLHDYQALQRLLNGGLVGWAEAYMQGEWTSPDLVSLIRWGVRNQAAIEAWAHGRTWVRLINRVLHKMRANTKEGSRRNIAYHYDLGNDFYRLWLDASMTYSSAFRAHSEQTLAQAQQHKYQQIAKTLGIQPGDTVLEIGCGWGGFAEVAAAEFGAQVTGITLSKAQFDYAQARIQAADLAEQCQFYLMDYRDLEGQYDHIVSIEMFEAVGEEHWSTYFQQLKNCLKPQANALLQVISLDEVRFARYRKQTDFIQKYIFPGGMLPTKQSMHTYANAAGLTLKMRQDFGQDYAWTLAQWRQAFLKAWPHLQTLGFDTNFKRMWLYYLAYCEGGFTESCLDVSFYLYQHQQKTCVLNNLSTDG